MADAQQQPPAEGGAAAATETKPDVKKEQINIRVVGQVHYMPARQQPDRGASY